MCYNAVDRHVESGRGDQPAIIYDSPVGGAKALITFRELQDQVRAFISLIPLFEADVKRGHSFAGVQVGGGPGEERRAERRPGGHLHAHGAPGHDGHASLRSDRRPPQPHIRRLRFQRALRPHRSRQGQKKKTFPLCFRASLIQTPAPQPKMIITASFGIEPGRRVEYIPLVEKALELSSHRPTRVLIYNRPNMVGAPGTPFDLSFVLFGPPMLAEPFGLF